MLIFAPVSKIKMDYSRHPWRSPCGPPSAFAFAVLQTQFGSPHHLSQPNLRLHGVPRGLKWWDVRNDRGRRNALSAIPLKVLFVIPESRSNIRDPAT